MDKWGNKRVKWKMYAQQSHGPMYVAADVVSKSFIMYVMNQEKNAESIDVWELKECKQRSKNIIIRGIKEESFETLPSLGKAIGEFFSMHYGMSSVNVYGHTELGNMVLLVSEKSLLYAQWRMIQSEVSFSKIVGYTSKVRNALWVKIVLSHNKMHVVKHMKKNRKIRSRACPKTKRKCRQMGTCDLWH